MSLKNVEKKEKNTVELTFVIDKKRFDEQVTAVFKKNAPKMSVPGFRKGKAPRAIIEKMYGKGVFYDDAVNDLLPEYYTEALKESKAEAVSQPQFEIVSIDEGGVEIKATIYVKPEVQIKDYFGIEAEKTVREATDEDVDREIQMTRERNSREIDVTDRAAQKDDNVIIDYEGFADGKAFEGGKAEKATLKLGSGQFIPGFEDQIVGHSVGDAFDVNVTFPKEYHAEDLAGKDATFKVKLHEIKFDELPELDDDFAKDVSEFDTLAEYKADVRAKLNERYEKEADGHVEEQIIDALIGKVEADIPDAMIETEAENMLRDYDNNLRMQGMNLNDFVKYTGMTLDTMREQFKPRAERQVKTRLALEKIAELEKIEATKEDIEGEIKRMAEAYGMKEEDIRKYVTDEDIAKDMAVKKAVELVKEKAVIKTVKAEEKAEKKPAKKTAAKKTADKEEKTEKAEKPAAKKTAAKAPKAEKAEKTEKAEKKPAAKKTAKKTEEK